MVDEDHPQRGEIWWADLPEPRGSEPGYRRPVLVIQADAFNRSNAETIVIAVITSNIELGHPLGNVLLTSRLSGLPRESVVNVSQLRSINRQLLTEYVCTLPARSQASVDAGLRMILAL